MAVSVLMSGCYAELGNVDAEQGTNGSSEPSESEEPGVEGAEEPGGEGSEEPGGEGSEEPGGEDGVFAGEDCSGVDAAATVRRLNVAELNHVARDVFSVDSEPFTGMPGDPVGFKTVGSSLGSDSLFTEDYFDRIEELSADVASALVAGNDCTWEAEFSACVAEAIEPYARRLFRRPLSEEQLMQLVQVASEVQQQVDVEAGVQAGLMATLTSPHFLFTDVDTSVPETRPATSHELAERLALTLWVSVPDDELLSAADRDLLAEESGLGDQIDRMLDDPRSDRFLLQFAEQWLALDSIGPGRVDALALGLDEAQWVQLVDQMKEETRSFVRHVFQSGGTVSDLITANYSILTDDLAEFYGLPTTGEPGFTQRFFPTDSPRQGILTQGSILLQGASGTHPEIVKRGATVVSRFLCRPPPTPPPGVAEALEIQLASDATERERMEERMNTPVCAGCHVDLDPIGYSFHTFDAAGRFRTVDEAGEVISTSVVYQGQTFEDANAVLDYLGQEGISECLTQNLLTYSLGRDFDIFNNKDDACLVASLLEEAEDESLSSLVRAMLTSSLFRSRSVAE